MPTLTPGDGQDLLDRFKRACERLDVDLALSLFREDAEYRPDPFEPALIGANAIREHWNEMAATHTNAEFDAERTWVTGTTILASSHGAFTLRETGERIRTRSFLTFELDDQSLITRYREWGVARSVGEDSTVRPEPQTGGANGR